MDIIKGFLINLKRRHDRLNIFNEKIINDINTEIEVVEAIDGRKLNYDDNDFLKRINPWNLVNNKPKSFGVIGCCLSHLELYKKMSSKETDIYLVFEDDVTWNNIENKNLTNILSLNFPDNWGIIYLNNKYYTKEQNNITLNIVGFNESISFTTESYLIKGSCAKELFAYNYNNIGAIDAHMQQYFSQSKYKQYTINIPLFKQDLSLNTDIQRGDYRPIYEKCMTFVINLKKRKDRLHTFSVRYPDIPFFDLHTKIAVDAYGKAYLKSKSYSILTQNGNNNIFSKLRDGEIGCLLSHYEIWKYMITVGVPFCCIYEDDAQFSNNYTERLHKILLELPEDFNILYLGGRFESDFYSKNIENVTKNIVQHQQIMYKDGRVLNGIDLDRTTHAYIISIQCARTLCRALENSSNDDQLNYHILRYDNSQLDHFMLRTLMKSNIPIFNSQPLINWSPLMGDSDIR
tara:strand:- start:3628 stop:5007 length:1380 start_codon:yes stop_codon:yes gene_type:complete